MEETLNEINNLIDTLVAEEQRINPGATRRSILKFLIEEVRVDPEGAKELFGGNEIVFRVSVTVIKYLLEVEEQLSKS